MCSLLWYGQRFLDTVESTLWIQSVLGKQKSDTYNLVTREWILETRGVSLITAFNTTVDGTTRRMTFTVAAETFCGTTTVTSET